MLQFITRLIAPPVLKTGRETTTADENTGALARTLYFVLLALLSITLFVSLLFAILGSVRLAQVIGLSGLPLLVSIWLTRRGRVQWATLIVLVSVLGLATYLLFCGDGLNDIAVLLFPVAIIAASLLLTPRAVVFVAGLSLLSISFVVYGQFTGRARPPISSGPNLLNDFVVAVIIITLTAVIVQLLAGNIRHSLCRAQRNERALADSNHRLQAEIAEHWQTQEQLRESEGLYRSLVNVLPEGVSVTDLSNKIMFASPALVSMYGGESPADAIGTNALDWVAPESRALLLQNIESLLQNKEHASKEFLLLKKDGTRFVGELNGALLTDAQGAPKGIVTVHRDITERKQAEEALRVSEDVFSKLFHSSPDAILLTEVRSGKIVQVNKGFERFSGYTRDELIGRRVLDLNMYSAVERQRFVSMLTQQGSIRNAEFELGNKSGEKLLVLASAELIVVGQVMHAITILHDVTERMERERELAAIATVSTALRQAVTRDEMLPIIAVQISDLLNAEGAMVGLSDPATGDGVVVSATGAWSDSVGERISLNAGIVGRVFETREIQLTDDLSRDPLPCVHRIIGDLRSAACAPLIAQNEIIGWICVGLHTSLNGKTNRILGSIADIAANAIHRATLHEQTRKDADELALAYDTTLEGWAHALELRDHETEGHTRRVTQMTVELAREFGIGGSELEDIRRGTLLHDIGKMGIPDSILLKPGTLTEREWEIMKHHPEYAAELLAPIKYLGRAMDIPYWHHEKWDGTGYPRGLSGTQIPLAARIFAIVDVWDALRSDRPYRSAWSGEKALAYVREQVGKHFDPHVAEVFLKKMNEEKDK